MLSAGLQKVAEHASGARRKQARPVGRKERGKKKIEKEKEEEEKQVKETF